MRSRIASVLREARAAALTHPEDGVQNSLTELAVLAVILIDLVVVLFGPLS